MNRWLSQIWFFVVPIPVESVVSLPVLLVHLFNESGQSEYLAGPYPSLLLQRIFESGMHLDCSQLECCHSLFDSLGTTICLPKVIPNWLFPEGVSDAEKDWIRLRE